jgi:hypothetical protein
VPTIRRNETVEDVTSVADPAAACVMHPLSHNRFHAGPHYSFEMQAGPGKPVQCRNFGRNFVKLHARTLRFAIRRVCAVPATLATCGPAYVNHSG